MNRTRGYAVMVVASGAVLLALLMGGCNASWLGNGGTTPDPDTSGGVDTNPNLDGTGDAIVADHHAADAFAAIPASVIATVQSTYHMFYGHTSHGSQVVTGVGMLAEEDASLAVNAGAGTMTIDEDDGSDLGTQGDLDWVTITRDALDTPGNGINVVMWSWCGGVSENTSAGINAYLNAMNQLEADYPAVTFVYMTGHLDGTGPNDNLYQRNNQIREYCRDNAKVLFDFADIESYDPDGDYYGWGSDACEWCETWCAEHTCADCDDCAHSAYFNCYRKGQAFWWMMARLTGWSE